MVINDLYYHIQGELEGRETTPGPFQELFSFLLDLGAFQIREQKEDQNILDDFCMFDISHIRRELGIELWDYSDWKASKEVAEKMLHHMHKANLMISLANSKLFGLKALIKALSVYNGNVSPFTLPLLLFIFFPFEIFTYIAYVYLHMRIQAKFDFSYMTLKNFAYLLIRF